MEKHLVLIIRVSKEEILAGEGVLGVFFPADPEPLAFLWFVLPGGEKEADLQPPGPGPARRTEMLRGVFTGTTDRAWAGHPKGRWGCPQARPRGRRKLIPESSGRDVLGGASGAGAPTGETWAPPTWHPTLCSPAGAPPAGWDAGHGVPRACGEPRQAFWTGL